VCKVFLIVVLLFFIGLCNQRVNAAYWDYYTQVGGVGSVGDGAGVAFVNLDSNARPEMILMSYDDPDGGNKFRYKIGWNVNANGKAASWSSYIQVGGVGNQGEGAGIAFVNLDSNARPEMILMAYDAPSGGNKFRYKIGWNVKPNGRAVSWSGYTQVGGVGSVGDGAGIAFVNLDSNARPEMILMAYDDPSGGNKFRYKIGWNVKTNGKATSWSGYFQVTGVGSQGEGADVTFVNLDTNPRPEMILMAYDAPGGPNNFRYRIGWNVKTDGSAVSWSGYTQVGGVGNGGDGAGMAFVNLDTNPLPEVIVMAYDDPAGGNKFRYRVSHNFSLSNTAEDDDHQFVGYVSDEEGRFVGYVWWFVDEYKNTWTKSQYYWAQGRFFGADHLNYVDSADLAFFGGHGGPSTIYPASAEGGCYLGNKPWGSYSSADRRGDLEYIAFMSCSVLKMDTGWRQRWKGVDRPFSGLHIAMGYKTTHFHSGMTGKWEADEFAENLEDGYSVRYAWYEAVEDYRWTVGWKGNKPAIFYIRPHENEKAYEHDSPDYKSGDPEYLLDAYYME